MLVPGIWKLSGTNFKIELISLLALTVDGGYLEIESTLESTVFVTYEINLDMTLEMSLTPSKSNLSGSANKVKLFN